LFYKSVIFQLYPALLTACIWFYASTVFAEALGCNGHLNLVHIFKPYLYRLHINFTPHHCLDLPSSPFPSILPTKICT
jgi:hypothetical protein